MLNDLKAGHGRVDTRHPEHALRPPFHAFRTPGGCAPRPIRALYANQ